MTSHHAMSVACPLHHGCIAPWYSQPPWTWCTDERIHRNEFGAHAEPRLLQADGGSGEYDEVPHPFLKVWDLLKEGKADATCALQHQQRARAYGVRVVVS